VLVAAVNAALVGVLLFVDVEQIRLRLLESPRTVDSVEAFAVGMVMLLILLVIWKVQGGKGRFLQGGVVSGHTAIAFFLSTTALFVAQHPLVAVLTVLCALLVAQARVEAGIHTLREVTYGALLGIFIPLVLYQVIPAVLALLTARPPGAGANG
jgi:diacylglycerol kinase (ATP)